MNLLLFKSYSLKGLAVVVEAIAAVAFAADRALVLPGGRSSFGTPCTYLYFCLFEKYVRKCI